MRRKNNAQNNNEIHHNNKYIIADFCRALNCYFTDKPVSVNVDMARIYHIAILLDYCIVIYSQNLCTVILDGCLGAPGKEA